MLWKERHNENLFELTYFLLKYWIKLSSAELLWVAIKLLIIVKISTVKNISGGLNVMGYYNLNSI